MPSIKETHGNYMKSWYRRLLTTDARDPIEYAKECHDRAVKAMARSQAALIAADLTEPGSASFLHQHHGDQVLEFHEYHNWLWRFRSWGLLEPGANCIPPQEAIRETQARLRKERDEEMSRDDINEQPTPEELLP